MVQGVIAAIALTILLIDLRSSALRLLELSVPAVADPRTDLELGCRFDMGGEELNSIKWYKDEQEFFRWSPRQKPRERSFPVAGVHLLPPKNADCTLDRCSVHLTRLSRAHSAGQYRCEVSSEAPAFRVAFDSANLTVAAITKEAPLIEGVANHYAPGELVTANCTSGPGDPAPILTWFINGKEAPTVSVGQPQDSPPDQLGLVSRSLSLRFQADRRHFSPNLQLRCVANVPLVPLPPKETTVSTSLRGPDMGLSNQKLEWANAARGPQRAAYLLAAIVLLHLVRPT